MLAEGVLALEFGIFGAAGVLEIDGGGGLAGILNS